MTMLQNSRAQMEAAYEAPEQGLDLGYYLDVLKRRFLFILVPFVLVLGVGSAIVMLLPPKFVSEGKILVETQQIPIDLVRPTVTATAAERIRVIEQRIKTRDNLLAIVDKFQLFPEHRQKLSGTELLDLMRERTHIEPFDLKIQQRPTGNLTIAVTVGFEYEKPDLAMRVANELITLLLNEDARNRTSRAMETTKFLAREVKRLEAEFAAIETQIAAYRSRPNRSVPDQILAQYSLLKAELEAKSTLFSATHPDIVRLKRQIAALEKIIGDQGMQADSGALDALMTQRASIQKNLEAAQQKYQVASLGESLERDQFSERLQVLEQAVIPQKPVKPNRPKLLAVVLALALAAGIGCVVAIESLDRTIRRSQDLFRLADSHMIVTIPYIATKAEAARRRARAALFGGAAAAAVLGALALAHFFLRPLDELWAIFLNRLMV
ncbi:MAG TPA: sugar transporter [Xanthobacteraceae bacterium]